MKKNIIFILVGVVIIIGLVVALRGNFSVGNLEAKPTFSCSLDFEDLNDICLENYGAMLKNCTRSLHTLNSKYITYDVDIDGVKGDYCYFSIKIIKSHPSIATEGQSMSCKINLNDYASITTEKNSFVEGVDVFGDACKGELKDTMVGIMGSLRDQDKNR